MQQQTMPTAIPQLGGNLAPKKKATNKKVTPIAPATTSWKLGADIGGYGSVGTSNTPVNKPSSTLPSTPANNPTANTQWDKTGSRPIDDPLHSFDWSTLNDGSGPAIPGLLKDPDGDGPMQPTLPTPPQPTTETPETVPVVPESSAPVTDSTGNAIQTGFTAKDYESNGYKGVQGNTNYNYDPRKESLVQNQITGLLDPNSDIMRKAISQAQNYSASRGLQSSSIGSETALSSMIDKALPIAQQDASTYATADQTGWQQSFTADQNNLNRSHDASMFDKQGELQTNLQNDQLNFNNTQANADRKQQMTTLDRQAQIQTDRDNLMNKFDMSKMDKTYLQDLEKTRLTWEHDDAVFTRNLDGQIALEYKNASSDAYNRYLEQVAAVYSNPNMTPEQQQAGVAKLDAMFKTQTDQLKIIYGASGVPAQPSGSDGGGYFPGDYVGQGPDQVNYQPGNQQPVINPGTTPSTGPIVNPADQVGAGSTGGSASNDFVINRPNKV